jgi:asparagine synthase (glutamine-hydrolysing)
MCGICGVYDLTGAGRVDPALVRGMCARIRHRGPDGDGFFDSPNAVLGMRRLSIIDVAGSDQPLFNEDGSLALVFNGEIYNYRELRAALLERGHRFRTGGDGETILHLYEEHGLDLFRYLRGMYAIALYDAAQHRLVLSVDHIGMKPLYLWEQDGLLHFASELKAFTADPAFTPRLNLDALDTTLSFGYPVGEETLFAGVRRLMPGHVLTAERGAIRSHRVWRFGQGYEGDSLPPVPADDGALIAEARERLDESVRLHLRSDVPLGLFLSGGVDSAAMLALMHRQAEGRIKTYTIGYTMQTGDNELAQAKRVAAHFQTDHHERVITAEDWWNAFDGYVYQHDEPCANPSAVSLMLLSELTARDVKVVLTGLGGDELFGGYPTHRAHAAVLRAARGDKGSAAAGLLRWMEAYYPAFKRYRVIGALPTYLPGLRNRLVPTSEGLLRTQMFDGMVFSDTLRSQLYGPALREAWQLGRHKERTFADIIALSQQPDPDDMAQALVINTWLTGNALLHADKVTMAHSLEGRIPFFDPALLAFAAAVPPAVRMRSNKYVLREAMRPLLPVFALERPKQPFSTPILGWFAGPLAARIRETLEAPEAFIRQFLNGAALDALLRDHFSGRRPQVEVVFRLLTLERWARAFGVTKVESTK